MIEIGTLIPNPKQIGRYSYELFEIYKVQKDTWSGRVRFLYDDKEIPDIRITIGGRMSKNSVEKDAKSIFRDLVKKWED